MNNLPKLQIALDDQMLSEAIKTMQLVYKEIDIIEIGTILCCSEGMSTVKNLKAMYPDKIILADIKIADAGEILSKMVFDAGADWTTVICCAPIDTVKAALKEAKKRNKDIQIELTGSWTFEQAKQWKEVGVEQVVYHRGRDAQAAGQTWDVHDLNNIERLINMGFKVSVTGGITVKDLKLFKDMAINIFIAGRSIRDSKDPLEAAKEFKTAIKKYWG
ncbi:3-dehydro-L-gulonate-6-phosphate decarboxylase [Thermoanaerobacter uzonensis DSM 18761]|jgi:3-dehydro-L-gulonate-6-phosphate decarboxylase|uniref:3-hexulose-6-phosphate synthase n=1 Tax=Thermoanaerobacter uzonensis DSM 18761 TaxID=1123369 RepID=A0A1M4SMH7_9THEO|nr:3-keto-L-gulonate-6-phosphate decarboxylase UlaD [Thermoanaerobacter uzonensis]SHE33406.1 3-dehydro-L-gulonate-6-phosphate decarboxylase [Thermoanaerobacter uzonensis DSM 18761]